MKKHKARRPGAFGHITCCGLSQAWNEHGLVGLRWPFLIITRAWKDVTCKNCLRARRVKR